MDEHEVDQELEELVKLGFISKVYDIDQREFVYQITERGKQQKHYAENFGRITEE